MYLRIRFPGRTLFFFLFLLLCLVFPTRPIASEAPAEKAKGERGADDDAPGGSETAAPVPDYEGNSKEFSHRIRKVMAYSDRAGVTRTAEIAVHPGSQWLRFARLPGNLDKTTLHVALRPDAPARILQVSIEDRFEHLGLPSQVRAKVDELRKAFGNLLVLQHEAQAMSKSYRFLQDLKFDAPYRRDTAGIAYRSFNARVDTLRASMEEIDRQSAEVSGRLQKLHAKIDELRRAIDHQVKELETSASQNEQGWTVHVYVLVEATRAVTLPVDVSYQIFDAQWFPAYDVRAELNRRSGTAEIKLVTSALVTQKTGEDWKDVQLGFSSLDPVPLYLPQLERWTLAESRVAERNEMRSADDFSDGVAGNLRRADVRSRNVAPAAPPPPGAAGGAAGGLKHASQPVKANPAKKARLQDAEQDAPARLDAQGAAEIKDSLAEPSPADTSVAAKAGEAASKSKPASAPFPLDPLETLFPPLADVTQAIDKLSSTPAQTRPFQPAERVAAPEAIHYKDERLPAVQAQGRLVELESPFKVDVKSDAEPFRTPLTSQRLKATLSYYAVPKQDTRVFLRAKTINTLDRPILAGDAQIFMDGDLVSKTSLPTVSENGFFNVDLGVDSQIETKRVVTKKAQDAGLIAKRHVTDVKVRIELVNHHPFPVQMEVSDNYPMAPDDNVEVKLEDSSDANTEEPGLLRWMVKVPASEKKILSFNYKVSHPTNYIVSEFD